MLEMTKFDEHDYEEHTDDIFYGIPKEGVFPPNDLENLDMKDLDTFDNMGLRFVRTFQ